MKKKKNGSALMFVLLILTAVMVISTVTLVAVANTTKSNIQYNDDDDMRLLAESGLNIGAQYLKNNYTTIFKTNKTMKMPKETYNKILQDNYSNKNKFGLDISLYSYNINDIKDTTVYTVECITKNLKNSKSLTIYTMLPKYNTKPEDKVDNNEFGSIGLQHLFNVIAEGNKSCEVDIMVNGNKWSREVVSKREWEFMESGTGGNWTKPAFINVVGNHPQYAITGIEFDRVEEKMNLPKLKLPSKDIQFNYGLSKNIPGKDNGEKLVNFLDQQSKVLNSNVKVKKEVPIPNPNGEKYTFIIVNGNLTVISNQLPLVLQRKIIYVTGELNIIVEGSDGMFTMEKGSIISSSLSIKSKNILCKQYRLPQEVQTKFVEFLNENCTSDLSGSSTGGDGNSDFQLNGKKIYKKNN